MSILSPIPTIFCGLYPKQQNYHNFDISKLLTLTQCPQQFRSNCLKFLFDCLTFSKQILFTLLSQHKLPLFDIKLRRVAPRAGRKQRLRQCQMVQLIFTQRSKASLLTAVYSDGKNCKTALRKQTNNKNKQTKMYYCLLIVVVMTSPNQGRGAPLLNTYTMKKPSQSGGPYR